MTSQEEVDRELEALVKKAARRMRKGRGPKTVKFQTTKLIYGKVLETYYEKPIPDGRGWPMDSTQDCFGVNTEGELVELRRKTVPKLLSKGESVSWFTVQALRPSGTYKYESGRINRDKQDELIEQLRELLQD